MPKTQLTIEAADGAASAGLFHPPQGIGPAKAGVILYMDAFGPRQALDDMAERLAGAGYLALVPDLFYRHAPYGPFDATSTFGDPEKGQQLRAIMQATPQDLTIRDGASFITALSEHGASGPIGVVGYCMGGARALNAAATYPDRIVAAASFHGGNLASEAADSPHLRAGEIKARIMVGSAGVDKSFPPEQSARLAEALRAAEVDHILENYIGMAHGWAVPDHGVHDADGAERHWRRLLQFFKETLG